MITAITPSAAEAMVRRARRVEGDQRREFAEMTIGAGIQTGPVWSGTISNSGRLDYTVIGEMISIATQISLASCRHSVAFFSDLLATRCPAPGRR